MARRDMSRPVFPVGGPYTSSQRPAMVPLGSTDYLFHDVGGTGWGRLRNIHDHKEDKVEANFHHLYDRFAG